MAGSVSLSTPFREIFRPLKHAHRLPAEVVDPAVEVRGDAELRRHVGGTGLLLREGRLPEAAGEDGGGGRHPAGLEPVAGAHKN